MAKQDMQIVLGGVELPKFTKIKRLIEPNETDKFTLGGTMFTYFKNNRRSWILNWKLLTEEDFTAIYDLYIAQYNNAVYHPLQINAYNVYVPVKMEISEQDIRYNGGFVENFNLTLKEQYAFS